MPENAVDMHKRVRNFSAAARASSDRCFNECVGQRNASNTLETGVRVDNTAIAMWTSNTQRGTCKQQSNLFQLQWWYRGCDLTKTTMARPTTCMAHNMAQYNIDTAHADAAMGEGGSVMDTKDVRGWAAVKVIKEPLRMTSLTAIRELPSARPP